MKKLSLPLAALGLIWISGFSLFRSIGRPKSDSSTEIQTPVPFPSLTDRLSVMRIVPDPVQQIPLRKPRKKSRETKTSRRETGVLIDQSASLFVRPPLKSRAPQFLSFRIDPLKGGTWIHPGSGTSITIPSNSLVFADGSPVRETVTFSYREFMTPSQIFLSGIPMKWKDGKHLESGGMLEIRANVGGRSVFLRTGQNMTVSMLSDFTDKNYNLYSFDEKAGQWIQEKQGFTYEENKTAEILDSKSNDKKTVGGMYEVLDSTALVNIAGFGLYSERSEKSSLPQTLFHLSYQWQYFPDLEQLGKYTYRSTSHSFEQLSQIFNDNKRTASAKGEQDPRTYDDIHILFPGSKGTVDIVFSDGQKQLIVGAEPVLKNQLEKGKFMNEYTRYSTRYDSAYSRRQYSYFKKQMYIEDFSKIKDPKVRDAAFKTYNDEKVRRAFTTNKFGILNCDRPVNINGEVIVNARFFIDGKDRQIREVYLADLKRNSIVNSMEQHFKVFRYSVADDNMIWAVLPGNKVGYLMPDDLQSAEPKEGSVDFEMKEAGVDEFLSMMDGKFNFFEKKNRSDLVKK